MTNTAEPTTLTSFLRDCEAAQADILAQRERQRSAIAQSRQDFEKQAQTTANDAVLQAETAYGQVMDAIQQRYTKESEASWKIFLEKQAPETAAVKFAEQALADAKDALGKARLALTAANRNRERKIALHKKSGQQLDRLASLRNAELEPHRKTCDDLQELAWSQLKTTMDNYDREIMTQWTAAEMEREQALASLARLRTEAAIRFAATGEFKTQT